MARVTKTKKTAPAPVAVSPHARLKALSDVADEFKSWGPGREVLTPVRSVPTVFPQFDVATRVKGLPIQRVNLVHGPSNHGKTVFLLGLGRSFLERNHFYFHVDAEMTTPEPWVVENLREFSTRATFRAIRPRNYEETADAVRSACTTLEKLRAGGHIPEDTTALFGIDSLQKLIPKDYLAKLSAAAKDGEKKGIDPYKGRGGMIQAAMNSGWMKELIPLMYHCNAGIVILTREAQNTEAQGMFDRDWKVGGGSGVYYDSSLVIRITRDGWVEKGSEGNKVVIGERHLVQVMKTKVGHKDAKVSRCYFHTSNGQLIPAGLDTARDVLELGLRAKTVTKVGNTLYDSDGIVFGNSMNQAVENLTADPERLNAIWQATLEVAQPEDEGAVADS